MSRRAVANERPANRIVAGIVLLVFATAACSGPILANPPVDRTVPARPTAAPSVPPDPQPVSLPRDDGPHQRLTEWWYYTGHLVAEDGRRFGFEAVVFRAERGLAPVAWASHLALTDEAGDRFLYAQRAQIGPSVDHSPTDAAGKPTGFRLSISEFDPANPLGGTPLPWVLAGSGGSDMIQANLSQGEAVIAGGAFGLDLALNATKPVALHGDSGWIDFGPAGSSYYYSRTRMNTAGTLNLGDTALRVVGTAWFDHQWGDFVSVGGGGWDWFAVNLEDGTDLTISLVRAADGSYPLVYGTLVDSAGATRHLEATDLSVEPVPGKTWSSPTTGATYPAGWTIRIPDGDLVIHLRPTVAAQELDTRQTTGVVYWEGSQVVTATRNGRPVGGEAYVELTGFAPAAR